ncbi:MAG: hypothetical protein IJ083_00820 [Clostridia bacterium]|nr:hypothetical protein [Clostridia bacterium]
MILGIDGGGTHSTGIAVSDEGRILAMCPGGSLNFHTIGMERTREHLKALVGELMATSGEEEFELMGLGLAALDGPGDEKVARDLSGGMWDADRLVTDSDAFACLLGGSLGEPGMAVICGTGSMILLLDGQGEQHVRSGWGFALHDAGSGYQIARRALLEAIDTWEDTGGVPLVLRAAMEHFGVKGARDLIGEIYRVPFDPARLAGFARVVLDLAGQDPGAGRAVASEMEQIAREAKRCLRGHPEVRRICLYGGIFEHSSLALEAFRSGLEGVEAGLPKLPPCLGAVLMALRARGRDVECIVPDLVASWSTWENRRFR